MIYLKATYSLLYNSVMDNYNEQDFNTAECVQYDNFIAQATFPSPRHIQPKQIDRQPQPDLQTNLLRN